KIGRIFGSPLEWKPLVPQLGAQTLQPSKLANSCTFFLLSPVLQPATIMRPEELILLDIRATRLGFGVSTMVLKIPLELVTPQHSPPPHPCPEITRVVMLPFGKESRIDAICSDICVEVLGPK